MPQIGGEIEQMTVLSTTFTNEANTIADVTAKIDGQVGGTWWVGPAAERFREAWNGEFKQMLARLQQSLNEASTEVNRRRDALVQSGS